MSGRLPGSDKGQLLVQKRAMARHTDCIDPCCAGLVSRFDVSTTSIVQTELQAAVRLTYILAAACRCSTRSRGTR